MERKQTKAAGLMAMVAGMAAGLGFGWAMSAPTARRDRNYPVPPCSPPEVIAAWNAKVAAAKRPARGGYRDQLRGALKTLASQQPKHQRDRTRKPHHHPLRDEHGAYTLVGSAYECVSVQPTSREHVISGVIAGSASGEDSSYTARRIWLAGISAQRGF